MDLKIHIFTAHVLILRSLLILIHGLWLEMFKNREKYTKCIFVVYV